MVFSTFYIIHYDELKQKKLILFHLIRECVKKPRFCYKNWHFKIKKEKVKTDGNNMIMLT